MAFTAFRTEGMAEDPFHIFRDWLPTGSTWHSFGFAIDPLTAVMLFMVPFVCLLIFIYAVGYMGLGKPLAAHPEPGVPAEPGHVDPLAARFFAYIALFACGMLGFILADNMILMFVFWEIMGLCSYLLIGFWFAREYADPRKITPKQAGLKAFLTTRIGDTIMLAGMFFLYIQVGSLNFSEIFRPETLNSLATTTANVPLIGPTPWATIIAILIFFGAIGKSAQFPLHVWLPDAMEGPTPVSALIHAATMVSAGVYLIIRTYPLMTAVDHGPALTFITFIGSFTALFAATIALAQNDIKKVLAYSTISQLGFMFAALGIGAYVAATFHLLTHAFFKSLLFLGSGSVIHGIEHGHHETAHGHGARTRCRSARFRPAGHAQHGRAVQADAKNGHHIHHWRSGVGRLPHRHRRLLEQRRNPCRRVGPRTPTRLHRPGAGGRAHGFLHRAADHHDLLRQAAHPGGGACR